MLIKIKDVIYIGGILISISSNLYSIYKAEKKLNEFQQKVNDLEKYNQQLKERLIEFKANNQAKYEVMTAKFQNFNDKINYHTNLLNTKVEKATAVAQKATIDKKEAIHIITNSGTSNSDIWYYLGWGVCAIIVIVGAYFYIVKPLNSSTTNVSDAYNKCISWFSDWPWSNKGNSSDSSSNNTNAICSQNSSNRFTEPLNEIYLNELTEPSQEIIPFNSNSFFTKHEQNILEATIKANPGENIGSLVAKVAEHNDNIARIRQNNSVDTLIVSESLYQKLQSSVDNLF